MTDTVDELLKKRGCEEPVTREELVGFAGFIQEIFDEAVDKHLCPATKIKTANLQLDLQHTQALSTAKDSIIEEKELTIKSLKLQIAALEQKTKRLDAIGKHYWERGNLIAQTYKYPKYGLDVPQQPAPLSTKLDKVEYKYM